MISLLRIYVIILHGGDVKIDESIIKECPECSKKLKSTAKFCTGCRFSFENVTKKIICEGKREDDGKKLSVKTETNDFIITYLRNYTTFFSMREIYIIHTIFFP
jgi:hypothetical protein